MKKVALFISLFSLWGCSTTHHHDHQGQRNIAASGKEHLHQIDRVGTAEVTQWFLCMRPFDKLPIGDLPRKVIRMKMYCKDQAIKDRFNRADSFNVSKDDQQAFRAHIRKGVLGFDEIDSHDDMWNESAPSPDKLDWDHQEHSGQEHPLMERMVTADWLLVDTTKPCDPGPRQKSYMDIEMRMLLADILPEDKIQPHETCGGRTVNDDLLDGIVTLFANGPKRLPEGYWGTKSNNRHRRE